MKARMNLIPFLVTIPEAERDKDLPEKLKAEWPGILHWMIQGCLKWQRDGLAPPAAVLAATEEYLVSENTMQTWIDECCINDAGKWTSIRNLFYRWKEWAEQAGERIGTRKDLISALETAGFVKRRRDEGMGFLGLELNVNWNRTAPM
jgi:putative DNA primase/helicase